MNMSSHDDGSDSEVDIYEDLPQVQNQEEALVKLEESKKQLQDVVENLKKQLDTLLKKNSLLESKCKTLSTNISSLYKTASAEIVRKDRMILELRKEKDSIIFRRDRKDLVKQNYTTNEHDQQVGEDTPDGPLNEEFQYTSIAIESTYENESDKIDSQSKYQRNIPACNDVQEYDTIFNKRQKQKHKLEKADKSEIENKNSDFMKGIAYTSDKSDLVSSKAKSSKSITSKTNIKDILFTDNSYKECDTDTRGLKHVVESQTSSEEHNIENISNETVPSNQSVSQALKNFTSTSEPQPQLKTLAKHQSINEKSTSYFITPQNTKAMISSSYSDCDRELKCSKRKHLVMKNYTTNESDQQVGENTPDEPLNKESQYTCIAIESTYENESDKINYQSKYQHNIPACSDALAVQEYDTIFNKRQKQKNKQQKADKSEIENKNSDFMKRIAYTSDKSDLASNKTKPSKSITSKTNIKYTLCTDNSYKECDTDTRGLKHVVESQTSSEEHNIENISHETVPSKQNVSQALKNFTSTSEPQPQLKTLAKHQSINEKSTSYFITPQNTKAMISSNYSDYDRELKCNNNNESKITVQTSNEVISERVNSTVLNTNANIFQFKLSEHCDFKRQRKCRIKHLSSATKEGLKVMINSKSDSSEDYRGFSRSEEVGAVTLKENSNKGNMDISKTSEICISSCYVNNSVVTNENISDISTNAKRKRSGTIIGNLENKFEIDKESNVNDRNNLSSKKNSAGISDKTDTLLDPEISINIDKNRDHKNGKEEASYCMREQKEEKSDNYTIGSEMHNVESKYSKSKYKETGEFSKSEKISIHFHDDIKSTSQNPISESRNSQYHELLNGHRERHKISNHYKNYHKSYGFSQMSSKERNRKLVRMSKRNESFKSGHQSFEDDREKFSTRKNFFKGRCQNYATKTWNVKERKQSSVLREPNGEIKKENSKKLRLSKKMSTQMNRYISDSKYDKTVTRSKCMNSNSDKTCNLCKLKNCECETGLITETEVKGLIDLEEHMLCKQDDSTRNDTSIYAGSLCAQEQKNKLEPVEAKNTCSLSNEEIQMVYSSVEEPHSDKNIEHFSGSSQIKIVSAPHNKVTNEDNIKKRNSLQNLETKISSKSPVSFKCENKTKTQIDGEGNCSLKITQECLINTKIVDVEISVNLQKETENCKIHREAMKEVKKSPFSTFNVKRRSRTYNLEDSGVVSVNITPPKNEHNESVNIVTSQSDIEITEVCANGKHMSQYSEIIDDSVNHIQAIMPKSDVNIKPSNTNNISVATNKDLCIKTEEHLSNDVNYKTDLSFRERYANVFSQESCYTSNEEDFSSSNSSYKSDQCSDESWHPGKRQKKKVVLSQNKKIKRFITF